MTKKLNWEIFPVVSNNIKLYAPSVDAKGENYKAFTNAFNCCYGGASVLKEDVVDELNEQALRVYFDYTLKSAFVNFLLTNKSCSAKIVHIKTAGYFAGCLYVKFL